MEFLHAQHQELARLEHNDGNYISAKGKDVIVVGGGDTGTDCVGTSMRHGCKSLTQLEILPRPPPDTRQPDNPWPEWPKVYKLDYGQEEAAARFGADPRVYLTTGEKFVGDDNGNVKEVHIVRRRMDARTSKGAVHSRRTCPGTEKVLPARPGAAGDGLSRTGSNRCSTQLGSGTRPAHQCEGRVRQVHDQCPRSVRRRRLPARPEPGGVGDQ